jgi:hypothetical protein
MSERREIFAHSLILMCVGRFAPLADVLPRRIVQDSLTGWLPLPPNQKR